MCMGMTLVMTITPSIQAARQDLWIAILAAGCITLVITFLTTKTAALYPGQDLIQLSQTILGKWLGKAVVLLYFIQWYTILPIVLRQFCDVIHIMILPTTPSWAVMSIMMALIVYASSTGGIETIARCSEILGPIVILMVLLTLSANLNNMEITNLLPVFGDSGMTGIVRGALAPASYLSHSVEYFMLVAFLYKPQKGTPYVFAAVITSILMVLIAMVVATATLGANLTPKTWYPFFEMSRKISVLGFIENLDPLPIVIWVASVFVKLAIYLFILAYGTAQYLQIKSWRAMVWLNAPVIMAFALIPKNVSESAINYLLNYWIPIALPLNMVGLPLLLLVVGKIRKARSG